MKQTTPAAMPPCFEKWCKRFDDVFTHKAQKREFRHYLGGLLGESGIKNLFQIVENSIGVNYYQLHHFWHCRVLHFINSLRINEMLY